MFAGNSNWRGPVWMPVDDIVLRDPDGRRPCHGEIEELQADPRWQDTITFFEYSHGADSAGLGAAHETGWTGLVADLICRPNAYAADSTWLGMGPQLRGYSQSRRLKRAYSAPAMARMIRVLAQTPAGRPNPG
ncbi:MAG: hypothetical protein WCF36_08915 [Candidatus Nanopelagicales bacterium]